MMPFQTTVNVPSLPELYNRCLNFWEDTNTTFWSDRAREAWYSDSSTVDSVFKHVMGDEEETERNEASSSVEKSAREVVVHSEPSAMELNPGVVTISSKDDFASSKPIGFQRIVPVELKYSRSNKGKKEEIKPMICNFCRNDPVFRRYCLTHHLKDPDTKVLSCMNLRMFICKICGATGDLAHTLKYCPLNKYEPERGSRGFRRPWSGYFLHGKIRRN